MQVSTSTAVNEPTCDELESKALIVGWESMRRKIRAAVTETAALPLLQICLHCQAPASMRCKQCGKRYYCQECFLFPFQRLYISKNRTAAMFWAKIADHVHPGSACEE